MSQRHISFLESGRSQPSRELIIKLGTVLDVPLRPHLANWEEVCADGLHWIQREAMSDGAGSEATRLLAELTALACNEMHAEPINLDRHALPFMPVRLRRDGVELNLFTTIATLGTPRDVTVHELRIESFFPADAATAEWFQEHAMAPVGAAKAL